MALALVCMECVNVAKVKSGWALETSCNGCGAPPTQGPGCGRTLVLGVVNILVGSGSVHKLVAGSLHPLKITLPLNITLHFWLSKMTVHPALQSGQIPMRDATLSEGTMCPVKMVDSPGIIMSHVCVDMICLPFGKFIVRGFLATSLLTMSRPSMMNMDVAPVLLIAWFVAMVNAFKYCGIGAPNICLVVAAIKGREWQTRVIVELFDTLDMAMVTASLLLFVMVGSKNE